MACVTWFKPAKASDEDAQLKLRLFPQAGSRVWLRRSAGCLSPLPSCHSVCLTCLLNRSCKPHRQTRRPSRITYHPWPCARAERAPEAREPGGLHGQLVLGYGDGGRVFYVLLGALGLQSCLFE